MTTAPPGWAFGTVLIANRGEIARRIIRTARGLGLRTVAVYSEADLAAPHVREADDAAAIGPASARDSYLNAEAILAAAARTGAGAIHPGYGFLSENADFARRVEAAGLAFVGPAPEQLDAFGVKHTARARAQAAGVPLLAGTGLLGSPQEAVDAARAIGFPVMVKATGGGGGIGMLACADEPAVTRAFTQVQRLAAANFGTGGIFLERFVRPARHVEVQIFGDGAGRVAVLGDRDCSLQRRNQKVLEEAPAPALPAALRARLHESARALAVSVRYRSAGTVEFVYDPVRQEASFLEVNARLQVEHPVTEEVFGIDLVEQMLRLAGLGPSGVASLLAADPVARGHAIEARVYAEDPNHGGRPSPGLVTAVSWPRRRGIRVDAWIEAGQEVPPHYDPMVGKVIAHAGDRDQALDALGAALAEARVDGVQTNLGLLRAVLTRPDVRAVAHSTSTLDGATDPEPRIEVLEPGAMTTVQDWPGRVGYWQVGVPPSGPMDEVSLREVNLAVGNPEGAPALECTASGPSLRFSAAALVCLGGAVARAEIDGRPVPWWEPVEVAAGATLAVGPVPGPGLRTYLAVRGGFDVPRYLGSASTFTLGRFGGHGGRALRAGDVLRPGPADPQSPHPAFPPGTGLTAPRGPVPARRRPAIVTAWEIGMTEGPHAAPEFFSRAGLDVLYASEYTVHFNSARTGVRLTGPRPGWAREDGGEAGLHPSNIHDTAYAIGALNFTGDTPIILGPDGPSLGGFVCPAVVASGDLWKIGQLRPGDTIRFVPVREQDAAALRERRWSPALPRRGGDGDDGVLARREGGPDRPRVTYRRDGDDNLIVEYGDQVLDLGLRMRVHALQAALEQEDPGGVLDYTPGIRSLQIHTDPARRRASSLLGLLQQVEEQIPETRQLRVPSRTVRLPLSWDDPATRLAIERYMNSVRSDAPWTPWNIEFIRRINGLGTVEDVHRTVFSARYLVLGLGDVYLGAPVATPLDPRHRLVTTKYNPARTWTAENSVGIGGAYLCIYGMEGPGGYQFVGRTVQVWNRFRRSGLFSGQPWSLRFFDQIEWYPVGAAELLDLRAQIDAGRGHVEVTDGVFDYGVHTRFLAENAHPIAAFRAQQAAAFGAEKQRWRDAGEFDISAGPPPAAPAEEVQIPAGAAAVTAPFLSSVWQIDARPGMRVAKGDKLLSLEAMKMETILTAPHDGTVVGVYTAIGAQVEGGQPLVAIEPAGDTQVRPAVATVAT
ncbi:MAG: Urea carboxylase [Actinomycetia bacterium]|nr:Urea carboxylase [Actinomycetes bacterium]